MYTLRILFGSDYLSIRRYFSTRVISKLFIIFCFIGIFSFVSITIYLFTHVFFSDLTNYEKFGSLTAEYILNAGCLILLWIGIASSILTAYASFGPKKPTLEYLLTLPILTSTLSKFMIIKTIGSNMMLLIFIFFPAFLAYMTAFNIFNFPFVLIIIVIFLSISVITSGIGIVLAIVVAPIMKNREYQAGTLLLVLFLGGLLMLIRVVFPPALYDLYRVPAESFLLQYSRLPLNQIYIPTYWYMSMANGSISAGIVVVTISVVIGILSYRFLTAHLNGLYRRLSIRSDYWSQKSHSDVHFDNTSCPIVVKDLALFFRNPTNTGYAAFLLSIAVFFFAMLIFSSQRMMPDPKWVPLFILFSMGWMLFFSVSFFMRIVFPLISEEGVYAWFSFTQPISRKSIINQKSIFASMAGLPFIILSILFWFFVPNIHQTLVTVMVWTAIQIVVLSGISLFFGAVIPEFEKGNNPEMASTTASGIFTLGLSFLCIIVSAYSLNQWLISSSNGFVTLFACLAGEVGSLVLLWMAAIQSSRHYIFPR